MKNTFRKHLVLIGASAVVMLAVFALVGCAPQQSQPQGTPTAEVATALGNDSVVVGEYIAYDPSVEAEETGGEAIEGSEEEELQQERIAGGATGAVVSKNLEPLTGITDPSEGDYQPSLGMYFQAPPLNMEGQQPISHLLANLEASECMDCHS